MRRSSHWTLSAFGTAVALGLLFTGTAQAADSHPMNSCPPGYQIDGQNSQQCLPASTLAGEACTESGASGIRDNNGNCIRNDTGY